MNSRIPETMEGMEPLPKEKACLVAGPVSPHFIAMAIGSRQVLLHAGAHSIFLGQVRADEADGRTVEAIEYEAFAEMADDRLRRIRREAVGRFRLSGLLVYHSTGRVPAGAISLFVMATAAHREAAQQAAQWVVEQVKHSVPVWKKEVLDDGSYSWKDQKIKDHERHQ